uniref:AlNc14C24G2415 protein n=1 Tax=Albugo laibachii Nc14 TaxID=890382 RepID=F0W6B6_9STRA|nr:AlNc14C24G2415 [Albugo laibachii Nc14]|eukprot:CCA16659.1 AlNc14C24G2415 [Albugo laibachii Nc14]
MLMSAILLLWQTKLSISPNHVGVHFRPSDSELFVWDRSNLGGRIFPSLPVMEKILLRILMS